MARHEGDLEAKALEPLSLNELLTLLDEDGNASERSREDAIACYLSGSEGWREAMKLLGGTFAEGATELRNCKGD